MVNDVRNGKYGKLLISYGYASRSRLSIGTKDPQEPPKELDFNLWLGSAPVQPFRTNLVHYNWHWSWDFGDGEIGNMGSHQLDVCRWALPAGATPKSVVSLGGRFGYQDQGQTPNTQLTMIDFGEAKLILEIRGLVGDQHWKITNEFHTDQGVVRDGKFFPKGQSEGVPIENFPPPAHPEQGPRHMRNFIDCVRSRKREDLGAEILEGHRTTVLAHLGNISYRLGEDVPFNKQTKAFDGDKTFHESFEDMKRHLADAAHLELTNSTYRLGTHAAVRRPGRTVRRSSRRRSAAQPAVPQPLRRAGSGVRTGESTLLDQPALTQVAGHELFHGRLGAGHQVIHASASAEFPGAVDKGGQRAAITVQQRPADRDLGKVPVFAIDQLQVALQFRLQFFRR